MKISTIIPHLFNHCSHYAISWNIFVMNTMSAEKPCARITPGKVLEHKIIPWSVHCMYCGVSIGIGCTVVLYHEELGFSGSFTQSWQYRWGIYKVCIFRVPKFAFIKLLQNFKINVNIVLSNSATYVRGTYTVTKFKGCHIP